MFVTLLVNVEIVSRYEVTGCSPEHTPPGTAPWSAPLRPFLPCSRQSNYGVPASNVGTCRVPAALALVESGAPLLLCPSSEAQPAHVSPSDQESGVSYYRECWVWQVLHTDGVTKRQWKQRRAWTLGD